MSEVLLYVETTGTLTASLTMFCECGPLRAVHLSCHKWPGGLVN